MFKIKHKISHKRKMKKLNPKYLVSNVIKMGIFLPITIIFFTDMAGPNLKEAFHNSIDLFTNRETGPFIFALILIINLALYVYLKPVTQFYTKSRKRLAFDPNIQKKAARKFNGLPRFIFFITIIGFLLGFMLDISLNKGNLPITRIPFFYGIFNALSTGLFAGTLLYLNTENILFPAKKRVFTDDCNVKQRYSSLYMKLFLTMSAIILFLLFQIFDSFSSFYLLGADRFMENSGLKTMESADFFNMSRDHDGLKKILEVLFFKILIYFFYVMHLLRQIKKMIKNPLDTVQDKLIDLNSDKPELSKQIDIINNDEFKEIFMGINKLIDKQNVLLQRSQEKLENIVDNAADPIVSFHDDGSIHVFNPAAESFFGYDKDNILSRSMINLIDIPEKIREVCEKDMGSFIDYISNFETKLKRFTGIHKNGDKINFESNVSSSETDHGTLYTAILRDISGQLEFEDHLTKAKFSAENANKMKSEFLANMSHELRTPLNAVLGFTQLLITDKNLTQGQQDKINTISRSGEHLLALINDILDISKIESGKTEMHENIFDLNQFVNDLKDMFILKCKSKDLSFYVEYAGDIPPYVEGDLGKLRQIMINIIGNAVKFTNEGGISLLVGEDKGKIRFSINDTGKGIPEQEIDKILQPFMQSSNIDHEGGTGLGLAISNSFIKMMGGELDIKSELGTGSTFSFELPFKVSESAPVKEKSRGTVVSIKGNKAFKALIVDDKVNNRLILKTMLENVGFITMEAKNGLEAIERTEEFDPEIIFMDIKMPVMDGYESVRKLKSTEQGQGIKIFALTASAFRHDEKKITESGFDGFLPKPFKLGSLFRIISDNSQVKFNYENDTSSSQLESELPNVNDLNYKLLKTSLSMEELEELSDMIIINDFAAIKQFADNLSNKSEMNEFRRLIEYYADNFNDQKLEELLENIRSQKNA
jgi:PAS domain S-box-containing protein